MSLGYLVESTPQKSDYTGTDFAAFTSNALAAVVTGETVIVSIAQDGPVPDSIDLSNGDSLALLHANPDGFCSIWGGVITTDDTSVTAQANWGVPEDYISVVVSRYHAMPLAINVLDSDDSTIPLGTNDSISGLTNAGSGKQDFLTLICVRTNSNGTDTEIHEQFALHEYRRLGGDQFSLMYDHVGNASIINVTLEFDYPNSGSEKYLVVVMIEAGESAADIALLAEGRGAPWIASGQSECNAGDQYVYNLATGGIIFNTNSPFDGWAAYFAYDAFIDRAHALIAFNDSSTGGTFCFSHENGPTLGARIPLPSGDTGWFPTVGGDLDFVPAGSFIVGRFLGPRTGMDPTVRVGEITYRVTPADGVSTITKLMASGQLNMNIEDGPASLYSGILGQLIEVEVDDRQLVDYRVGGDPGEVYTAAYLCFYIYNNTRTSDTDIIVQQNDADSALLITVPAGFIGYVKTDVLTLAGESNDDLRYRYAFGAGSGQFGIRSAQLDLISTNRRFWGGLGQDGRVSSPVQFPMAGLNSNFAGGYATDSKMVAAFTLDRLNIKILDNDGGGALTVYQNGEATSFLVTIGAETFQWVDVSGALAVSEDDETFDLLYLILTALGATLDYSVISWAAVLEDLTPPTPIIGELAWVHRTRRLPADGSLVTETYSDEDMQCPEPYENGFKEALVADFGDAERVSSDPVTGRWRGSTCTVRYIDTSLHFRQQAIDPVNRYLTEPAQLKMTTRANRAVLGEPYTVFTGALVSARPVPPLGWEETYGDLIAYGKRANQTDLIPWRVLGDSFIVTELAVVAEGLDLLTPEPIIYGRHIRVPEIDGASEQGFVFPPIYLGIETVDGIDKHVWMISGHANAEIVNLRVDLTEVFTDPEWEIPGIGLFPKYEDRRSPTYGNDRRYSLIRAVVTDLTAAEELLTNPDACALGVKKLTVAVEGIERIGDGSGELITDRLECYLHYEQNFGQRKGLDSYQSGAWLATPEWNIFGDTTPAIDEDSYTECAAIALERFPGEGSPGPAGYVCAAIIGARPGDRRSRADRKAQWNRSCSTRSGITNLLADRVFMLHPTQAIKDAAELYTDATEINRDSFQPDIAWDQQQTRVKFVCDPLHDSGQWQTTDTITDGDAVTNYGDAEQATGETREYDFAPGITQASHLAIIEGRRIAHPPRPVTLAAKVPPDADGTSLGYKQVGDYIRYRSFQAIANSPSEIRLMQIERVVISPSRRVVTVEGQDCDDLIGYDAPEVAASTFSPPNDTCAAAIEITGSPSTPYTVTVDTTDHATDPSIDPPIVAVAAYHAAWWTITPDETGRLFVTTVHSQYDTQLAILTGTCGVSPADWTLVDYNDNDNLLQTSVLDIAVVGGQQYYILVAGYGPADGGRLVLSVQAYVPE